jgi:RNA polymerase sigma factor (sigma-70 family)
MRPLPSPIKKSSASDLDLLVDDLERLYRDRYVGFRNSLAAVTGSYDTARDAVQEGFARALANREQFHGGSLAAWVWKIAYHAALEGLATQEALLSPIDAGVIDSGRDPALAAALCSLPPRRRLIVFLRYYVDFSYSEIAVACAVSEGTVAATLAQARQTLALALDTEGATTR